VEQRRGQNLMTWLTALKAGAEQQPAGPLASPSGEAGQPG
jgi:hypothetical protein